MSLLGSVKKQNRCLEWVNGLSNLNLQFTTYITFFFVNSWFTEKIKNNLYD